MQKAHDVTMQEAMDLFAVRGIPVTDRIPEAWKPHLERLPAGENPLPAGMEELGRRLLAFGGSGACFPDIEEDMALILQYGQLWNGWSNTIRMEGEPCQCHSNSAWLMRANEDTNTCLTIATGYALSADGIWRQHSWLVQKRRSIRIIETTKKRVLYYGAALAGDALDDFLYMNM